MEIPKIIELCYSFGEAFILSLAGLTYMGIAPSKNRLAIFSISFGLFTFIIKTLLFPILHIPDGIHIIAFFAFNIFFLIIIFKLTLVASLICDLLYFATIIIFENTTLILFKLVGINPAEIHTSLIYINIFRWLNFLLISLLVYSIIKSQYVLLPIKKVLKLERNGN